MDAIFALTFHITTFVAATAATALGMNLYCDANYHAYVNSVCNQLRTNKWRAQSGISVCWL